MPGWNEAAWFSLLVGAAFKSTAVLGAAWLVALALRGRSAAALHLVWTAGAAALLTLPLLSLAIPAVRVSLPGALVPAGVTFRSTVLAQDSAAAAPGAARAGGSVNAPVKPAAWRPDWRLGLMLLWAAGCATALAQMLAGWTAMQRVRRTAMPFREPSLPELLTALEICGAVDVLETRAGRMPVSFGLFRPAVLMPADARDWSAERRRVVLLHELAHVRRGDHATHVLARAALSLYWWNPLAWMAWREFLKARERAADDLVLGAGAAAPEYASHLLEIARSMQASPAVGWAAVAMARPSQLEGRLLAILDSGRSRKSAGRASAWVAGLAAAAIAVPLAALQAQDAAQATPAVDATIRTATAQRNHEMLESAAKAAEAERNYDTARRLLDSSLAIREQASGQHSASYGLGLLKIGDLERARVNTGEAEAFYQKALSVLNGTPDAATALIDLGTLALTNKNKPDYDMALEYFGRAQGADPTRAGTALMWMAITFDRQGRAAEAESLLHTAMAVEDPNSAQAATIMEMYALFLRRNNRADDAKGMEERAGALRKIQGQTAPVIEVNPRAPGGDSEALRVGNGVTAPQIVHKIEPEYSEEARAAKYQGSVVLYVEIGPDGKARNMRVERGLGLGLDQKAIDAVSQWQFQPGMKDGLPVIVQATIEVNFRLL
jgi:TonB family protein